MSSKDEHIVRGTVIGGVRKWFDRNEVALKIVSASVRHGRASVSIVYFGKATKAEVAAAAAYAIASSIPRSYRLRKLSYVRISVSKTGSSKAARFLMNLRIPRSSYVALANLVKCLRKLGVSVRKWMVRNPGGEARVVIEASYGLPELDRKAVASCLESALNRISPSKRVCMELSIRTRIDTHTFEKCVEGALT